MNNYMFDTNIFNRIIDGNVSVASFKKDNKYYVTHIQVDELNDTKNRTRRSSLLQIFQTINNIKITTESAVFDISKFDEAKFSDEDTIRCTESLVLGVSRLGMSKLSDGNFYNSILNELTKAKPKEKDNNIKDALIGETSIKNNFTLVTADTALYDIVKSFGGSVLNWNEFLTNRT